MEIVLHDKNKPNITENVFENLVNFKRLVLRDVPIPNGIFDTLTKLQKLTIHSETYKELIGSDFKNQRNLVYLFIHCEIKCLVDPFIFEYLSNLEKLHLISFRIPRKVLANMLKLKHVIME